VKCQVEGCNCKMTWSMDKADAPRLKENEDSRYSRCAAATALGYNREFHSSGLRCKLIRILVIVVTPLRQWHKRRLNDAYKTRM
jgi:hypothetical protein